MDEVHIGQPLLETLGLNAEEHLSVMSIKTLTAQRSLPSPQAESSHISYSAI
jgi:hypothetical protein